MVVCGGVTAKANREKDSYTEVEEEVREEVREEVVYDDSPAQPYQP